MEAAQGGRQSPRAIAAASRIHQQPNPHDSFSQRNPLAWLVQGGQVPPWAVRRAAVLDVARAARDVRGASMDGSLDGLIGQDGAVRRAVAGSVLGGIGAGQSGRGRDGRIGGGSDRDARGKFIDGLRHRAIVGPWHARLVALGIAKAHVQLRLGRSSFASPSAGAAGRGTGGIGGGVVVGGTSSSSSDGELLQSLQGSCTPPKGGMGAEVVSAALDLAGTLIRWSARATG